MLLLFLPENKGGEDYTWILSLFMVRSNPLQSLVWLSSGKSLGLRTAGMQTPGWLARSTGRGPAWSTVPLLWPAQERRREPDAASASALSRLGSRGNPFTPLYRRGN